MKNKLLGTVFLWVLGCAPITSAQAAPTLDEPHSGESNWVATDLEKFESYRPHDVYSNNCIPGKLIAADDIIAAQAQAKKIAVKKIFHARDPHQHLIFISTDGTGKNAADILGMSSLALVQTLRDAAKSPAECQHPESKKSAAPVESFPANPALLAWLVQRSGNSHVHVVYVHGVGADPLASNKENLKNQATGDTLDEQIDSAYAYVGRVIAAVLAQDGRARFTFVSVGFSRGAAAARALNNKILHDGYRDADGYVIQPGAARIGASVLFDTVITQWVDMSAELRALETKLHVHSGPQEIDASQYLIPNNIVQVLHITALNEYRLGFELKPATGENVQEIALPGAHSDIGGGYGFDGISAATLQMAIDYLQRAGVPMAALPDAFLPDPKNFAIHDARKVPLLPFDEQIQKPRVLNTR